MQGQAVASNEGGSENNRNGSLALLQLPGYEFTERIGEGGMATVFKGRQLSLDRSVAIKVLNQQMCKHDQVYEAFEREAVIIARLNHPNIIHVIDRGITEHGTPFFIMEYVDGVDLSTLMREGQLPLQKKIEICLQICKALSYAHKNGVIHRDVKPANVLVDSELNAKVLDFGIALFYQDESYEDDSGIQDGSERDIMGTYNYMAPELSASAAKATFKSDIYSLGVIMYELFAGVLPTQQQRLKPPKDSGLPDSVADLVMSCLSPKPDKRPRSMIDIYERLLLLLHGSHLNKQQIKRANDSVNNRKTFSLLDVVRESSDSAVYLFIEKNSGHQFIVKKTVGRFDGFEAGKRLAKISHPHIARVHGASKNDRAFIVVMDYLRGGSLQERLLRPYDFAEFLRLARQLCQGLLYAHSQQLLHGNLRSNNILFDDNNNIKIADFGMLQHLGTEDDDVSELSGDSKGKSANKKKQKNNEFNYRLPQEPLCPQSDIYALGVIFYLMLIGALPRFHNDELQLGRAFKRLPQEIQALLQHMLKRNVTERPRHLKEVIAVFDQYSTDMPTQVWSTGGDISGKLSDAAKQARRKKLLAFLLVLLVCVVSVNAGILLYVRDFSWDIQQWWDALGKWWGD